MKKQVIYIFLLVILAMPFGVNAQDFNFGLQFGIVPSQVDGDGMTGYNKIGLTAGCFVTRDITKDVFLYTDLSFTMKGSKVASSKNVNFDQLEISANYIDWGIYAGYRFTDKINLKAGLIPSVLIYSNEKTPAGNESLEDEKFRAFNMLVSGGLSYHFSKHFAVNATYNYSIFSIRPGEYEVFDYDIKISNAQYHHYLNIGLMYQF